MIAFNVDKFKISDPKCSLTHFTMNETTKESPGLQQVGCPKPGTSEACRSIILPTDTARILGNAPGLFSFEFYAHQLGNNSIKVSGTVEVPCSDKVVVIKPTPLSSSATQMNQGQAEAIYEVDEFSTDDASCPIKSYGANEFNKDSLPDGIS